MSAAVTPFTGVWIETVNSGNRKTGYMSRPSRACGLKPDEPLEKIGLDSVTPFTGVWIETTTRAHSAIDIFVTPFTGVWIETSQPDSLCSPVRSRPST